MNENDLSFNKTLDNLPDIVFWPIMEGIEEHFSMNDKKLDDLINELLDPSAKITADYGL